MDAQTLALFLLKTTVLLLAGAALAMTLRRASAGTRHQVWLATLAGLLVLPALLRFAPVRLELLPRLPAAPEPAALPASMAHVAVLPAPLSFPPTTADRLKTVRSVAADSAESAPRSSRAPPAA